MFLVWISSEFMFLLAMVHFRPNLWVMLEQPSSSWMSKLASFREVQTRWGLSKFLTYLGKYGHDMWKPTHLFSNMSTMTLVACKGTKKLKESYRKRMQRKRSRLIAAGKSIPVYWTSNAFGYHGGAALAKSATYPRRFANKLFQAWEKQRSVQKRKGIRG